MYVGLAPSISSFMLGEDPALAGKQRQKKLHLNWIVLGELSEIIETDETINSDWYVPVCAKITKQRHGVQEDIFDNGLLRKTEQKALTGCWESVTRARFVDI